MEKKTFEIEGYDSRKEKRERLKERKFSIDPLSSISPPNAQVRLGL